MGILIKFNIYLGIRELELVEANEVIYSTITQYFEDRTFDMYVIDRMFNPQGYISYKESFNKANKEIDVEKIKKATNKALNAFVNSYGKEVNNE